MPTPDLCASLPPALILLGMLSLGCTVPQAFLTARVVNETDEVVRVEYAGGVAGRNQEQLTVDLAPGGAFSRSLAGRPGEIKARAAVRPVGGSPIEVPIDLDDETLRANLFQTATIRRGPGGLQVVRERPQETPR